MEIKAYAKINLGLDVLGRRPDGYHEVRMIMQTVDLYDTVSLEKTEGGITLTVTLLGKEEAYPAGIVPDNEENLAYKAAKLIKDTYEIEEGVRIHLQKRIPAAAGMAGGSTDAAAVLRGMNRLFGLKLSPGELERLGVRLGADVPYCVRGGTVLAEGIGEKLTGLRDAPNCVLLIAKKAIEEGSLDGILRCMGNVLQSVTEREYPVIGRLKEQMEAAGAKKALMSGSGPTVFGIFTEEEKARKACETLQAENGAGQIFLTGFISPEKEEG